MNYVIIGNNFTSPLLRQYQQNPAFCVKTEEELADINVALSRNDKIYAPDETSFPLILDKIADDKYKIQLETIKNKFKCRELLKEIYPNFYFRSIKIADLHNFVLPNENGRYFIKPQKGFFGVAVREINKTTDLLRLQKELKEEISKGSKCFSKEVYTADDFLIEEYVEGEEYTFDLFYNEQGKPVIVNFCHHPMSLIKDYFHLLYYTCPDIYNKFSTQVKHIFTALNNTLKITNLPIHVEFREQNGQLVPIEINVPRFGGFGLADLPFQAYGVNPFDCFFEAKEPDWNKILPKHEGKYYGWVLCYNGLGVDLEKSVPDYKKLFKDLGITLSYHQLDYQKNPAFCIAYVQKQNKKELQDLLKMDFRDYFKSQNI